MSRVTLDWLSSPSPISTKRAPKLLQRPVLGQLVATGEVDRVVERGAAARPHRAHAFGQLFGVVGEVDDQLGRVS
jgi:hypothetical protein